MAHKHRDPPHPPLELKEIYREEDYPRYDNYEAIEVSRVDRMPRDYYGVMGVPLTYLHKWNPSQFEILGKLVDARVQGKNKYVRLMIKRHVGMPENE